MCLLCAADAGAAEDAPAPRFRPKAAPRRHAVARVIPSAGRVVGLLEWVEAHLSGDDGRVAPTQCELSLRGPHGPVAGTLSREGRKLKFVPTGTGRIELTDLAVVR